MCKCTLPKGLVIKPYGRSDTGAGIGNMYHGCGMAAEFEHTPYIKSSFMP